ncbi:MAG: FAD-dependent oxidoreductase [Gammaproteobacteria bacterium]
MNEVRANPGHAAVIGAGIAGLLAARVLADHFAKVTILERDALPESAEPRKRVPQGRHVHALLIRGEQVMVQLLPGLAQALLAAGATRINFGADFRWHHFGRWKKRYTSTRSALAVSRPCIEWEIRREVLAIPNVRIIEQCDVSRYATNERRSRITGVHIEHRSAERSAELLPANLVVDASGRGSRTSQHLPALGYAPPMESTLQVNFGYASRLYRQPTGARDWRALYAVDTPPKKRGGLVFPIEGERWMVTLFGWHGAHAPTDDAGFLEFARGLPVPDVYQALRSAEPLTDAVAHGFPASWRRHYERLESLPKGLLVLGDALCSFNPIYGQGMTVSALEAAELDTCLREYHGGHDTDLSGLSRTFHRKAAKIVDSAWMLATGEDLRFPETIGRRSLATRFLHWYMGLIHAAAEHHALVTERFYEVMNMIAPPSALFRPDVLAALLAASPDTARPHQVGLR